MNNTTFPPVRLVVFDWAGTSIDFGSQAPAVAFRKVFAANGIEVSDSEVREPMGLNKRLHLIAMLKQPAIADRWQSTHGREWNEADVDRMYDEFVPFQLEAIRETSELIPGFLSVVQKLREREIKVVGTTGYFREAADLVTELAADKGYLPDLNLCADDVPEGRPAPWMIFRAMQEMNVYPARHVLKVGDTVADIEAGVNAGCLTVGVCDSSSVMGHSRSEYESLTESERNAELERTSAVFHDAGADAVIHTIEELPALIEQITASNPTPVAVAP